MTRLRTILAATALCTGLLVLLTETQAQGPGRGGGGPGGGRGGFGGPGFGGFGGFGGGSASTIDMGLLQNEAVQKELKLSEKQKAQIEQVRSGEQKKRQTLRDSMRPPGNGNGNAGGGPNNGGNGGGNNAGGNGGGNNGGGNNGGRTRQRNNNGPGGGGPGGGGGGGGGAGGPGGGGPGGGGPGGGGFGPGGPGGGGPGGGGFGRGFFGMDPAQMEAMREQMQAISTDTQSQLKQILNPTQVTRVQQINLQRADVFAVGWPDVAERLNLTEEDVQAVTEINQQMRGETGRVMQETMKNMPRFRNADGSRLSREEMTKKMEEPEVKAQMDKLQTASREQTDQIRDGAKKAIARLLTKKQKASFNKMLGAPFDLTLLNQGGGGMFGRGGPNGRGGGPNGGGGATAKTAATPNNATPTTNASNSTKADSKTAATPVPKKKSALSSRRSDD